METMTVLILGYGKAGKRHASLLDELGVTWWAASPHTRGDRVRYHSLEAALDEGGWGAVCICSPPDLHLEHIWACLDAGLPVLCEKPLCGFGQLEAARALNPDAPVMLAFNKRFHPDWRASRETGCSANLGWTCISYQSRPPLPPWGLLLDHLGHTYDTLLSQGAGPITIRTADHIVTDGYEAIAASGMAGDRSLDIWDCVNAEPTMPVGGIVGPFGFIRPDPAQNKTMFLSMWQAFFEFVRTGQVPVPGLREGLAVQELLEETYAKMGSRNRGQPQR